MWLAPLYFISCNNHFKEKPDPGSLQKRMRGCAHRARSYRQLQLHFAQLFQGLLRGSEQTYAVSKKVARDLAAPLHQLLDRRRDVKGILVKFDCDTVTHAKNIAVI